MDWNCEGDKVFDIYWNFMIVAISKTLMGIFPKHCDSRNAIKSQSYVNCLLYCIIVYSKWYGIYTKTGSNSLITNVVYIWFSTLYHHVHNSILNASYWFRIKNEIHLRIFAALHWLVASHYMNQYLLSVKLILRSKFRGKYIIETHTFSFNKMHVKTYICNIYGIWSRSQCLN